MAALVVAWSLARSIYRWLVGNGTMPAKPPSPDYFLTEFRTAYYKMCLAAVHVLREGKVPRDAIIGAMNGQMAPKYPVLREVVELCNATRLRLEAAMEAGVKWATCVEAARQAREVVQGEFIVQLPIASEV